jgi:CheY-like chemotaxis protein
MKEVQPVVWVIDDDPSVREALQGLLETAALQVELYVSPREYLQRKQIALAPDHRKPAEALPPVRCIPTPDASAARR